MSSTAETLQLNGGGDDGQSFAGTTRVANEVVGSIAALAALQVPGVHAMYHPGAPSIDRIVRRSQAHRGVRVELREGVLHLDLWVVVESGSNVPALGAAVQRRVADAVERMLDMRIAEVNVLVSEVVFT